MKFYRNYYYFCIMYKITDIPRPTVPSTTTTTTSTTTTTTTPIPSTLYPNQYRKGKGKFQANK